MRLKDIILEGMYDNLTGQINKDIFKTLKNAINGSGTQDKPKKYNGYNVRKEPISNGGTLYKMFQSERRTLHVGEYSDNVSGLDVDVELKVAVTSNGVTAGKFFIDGSATADVNFPSIQINIGIHPDDINGSVFSKIQPILRDIVRHELEHISHSRNSAGAKPSKILRRDSSRRAKIDGNEEAYYKYYLLPKEVDANIHGLYSKAKTMKQPYQKVVDDYLDSLVDDGIITKNNRKLIYKTWQTRIPLIGGIPKLK